VDEHPHFVTVNVIKQNPSKADPPTQVPTNPLGPLPALSESIRLQCMDDFKTFGNNFAIEGVFFVPYL
jgi:hypothetical protein